VIFGRKAQPRSTPGKSRLGHYSVSSPGQNNRQIDPGVNEMVAIISAIIISGHSNLTKGRITAAHGRYSLCFTMGRPFPLKIAPSHCDLDTHLIHGPLGPPESI